MNIIEDFKEAILFESQKNAEEYESIMALPLSEKIAKGVTMANFTIEFEFRDLPPSPWDPPIHYPNAYISAAHLVCNNNISKFKEGSKVILSNGIQQLRMEIKEDSVDNFILEPQDFHKYSCFLNQNDYSNTNWELNEDKSDATEKMLTVTAEVLSDNDDKLERIAKLLNRQSQNNSTAHNTFNDYLNASQNKALYEAVNADEFCLIQGPPGTGKTATIAFIAKYFIEQGQKVFVTAPTHTAINNCLNAISERVQDKRKIVKIGTIHQNKEIINNNNITCKTSLALSSYENNHDLNQNGIVIGATPYSVCYDATKRLRFWEFDVCIIDEASQLSIPLSLAAMSRSRKYIFVGDQKQLDPIVPNNNNLEMFSESVFSRLTRIYEPLINLLDTSYRLNEMMIKIPNKLFYSNKLQASEKTKIDDRKYECTYHDKIINNDPHILILHDEFDGISDSKFEAEIVTDIIYDLAKNNVKLNEIGIVTPYRAQVRKIRRSLLARFPKMTKKHFSALFIDTVDSMQGQQRNFIIYSFANSHPLESKRRLDFFYSPNRLNVAITRAVKKCFVISNYKVFDIIDEELMEHSEYNSIKDSLEIFKEYKTMASIVELNQNNEDEW